MALYAFDGTWQYDYEDANRDTNVVRFRDAYQSGEVFYQPGVGTRFGWLGRLIGAITGAGGRKRVGEALDAFHRIQLSGDSIVDIVGFSRGAALALHFANALPSGTPIRFLGLFDTVPSFGIPGNNIDLGWNLKFPPAVEHCCHAMALHETRYNFPLHRLDPNPRLNEVWFRGVHSDIGGGNGNTGLSSIALDWVFDSAHRCGMNLKASKVAANRAQINPSVPVSPLKISSNLHRRSPRPEDCLHPSVR